jgi:DNA repair protein RAD5
LLTDVSIVFSYCPATLDILEVLLSRAGIYPLRIDGTVSQQERLRILERFRESPDYPVLLMTVGTGAVGYVHIAVR